MIGFVHEMPKEHKTMSEVQDQVEKILSDDLDKQLDGLKYLNKYLAGKSEYFLLLLY